MVRSPKLSAPTLDPWVIETSLQAYMQDPSVYHAHWLHAGPGAGKTQGTRLWLEKQERPFAWIQLDPLDNDPVLLLESLRLALLDLLAPGALLPSFNPSGGVSLARHCEFFWGSFFVQLQRPATLVLDDAHLIAAWEQHPVLHALLFELDPRLHVVVLSRSAVPESYARHVVNRRIHYVEPKTFVWREEHLRTWLERRWRISRPAEPFVASLLSSSQGWAAVLGLLDIQELLEDPRPSHQYAADQLELRALIDNNLLQPLPPAARTVLRWLASMGSFPERWLEELELPAQVAPLVRRWQQDSAMVVQLEGTQGELRFHPLFAELLQRSPIATSPRLSKARNDIIDACIQDNRRLDAISVCRNAQDWSRYWSLVQDAAPAWIEQGQLGLLQQALASLPQSFLERHDGPTLWVFLAAARLQEDPVVSYHQSVLALNHAKQNPDNQETWAMALAIAANAVVVSGLSLDHFTPLLHELAESLRSGRFDSLSAGLKLQALRAGLMSSILGTEIVSLAELHDRLIACIEDCPNTDLQATTISAAMRLFVVHGLSEYIDSISHQLSRIKHLANSPTAKLSLAHARTNEYLARGEKERAAKAAIDCLAYLSNDASFVWQVELLATAAFCFACCGKIEQTQRVLTQLQELERLSAGSQNPSPIAPAPEDSGYNHAVCELVSSPLHGVELNRWMYQGCIEAHQQRFSDAAESFAKARSATDAFAYPLQQVVARSSAFVMALELGDRARAQALIDECVQILAPCKIPLAEQCLRAMRAFFALRCADNTTAVSLVRTLMQQLRDKDSYLVALDMLPQTRELLSFALEHEIEPKLVEQLIRRAPLFPPKRPHPRWPSLFELRVVGRFSLSINGKEQRSRFMSSGRRFELLTTLFWEGGRELPHQACFDIVWPYIEPKRQPRVMKSALRRLQEDLGHPNAILDQAGTLSLNPNLWSFDAWDLAKQLERLSPAQAETPLRKILSGFFGPTVLPAPLREMVPSQGGIDLGPKPLLPYLR